MKEGLPPAPRLGWNGWRPTAGLYQRVPRWLNGWRHHLASRVVTNSASTQAKQQQFYGGSRGEVGGLPEHGPGQWHPHDVS